MLAVGASARWGVAQCGMWGVLGSRRPDVYKTWFISIFTKQLPVLPTHGLAGAASCPGASVLQGALVASLPRCLLQVAS